MVETRSIVSRRGRWRAPWRGRLAAGSLALAVAVWLAVPSLQAALGDVLSSFASPNEEPWGLTWDGANLWHADDKTDRIYRLTTGGSIVSSFTTPEEGPRGLAWDGVNLWHADKDQKRIYNLTPGGTVLSSFPTPSGLEPDGLTFDGTYLWLSIKQDKRVYRLTTTGTVISFFSTNSFEGDPAGLTWDGTNLWLAGKQNRKIYALTTAGAVVRSFNTPCSEPKGLTFDGTDFWLACRDTRRIYRLEGPRATVTLSKTASPATPKPGDTVLYTLTYGNTGSGSATSLVITDAIPANTTLVPGSITDGGTASGGTITWILGTLPAGAVNRTVKFSVTVNAGVPVGTVIPNSGTANYQSPPGNARPPVNSNVANVTVAQKGGVSVAPNQSGAVSSATNSQLSYTFTITNTGNGPDFYDMSIAKAGPYYWPTELYDAAGTTLLARDSNADGVWDFVNSSIDSDADGQPDTAVLAAGASVNVVLRLTVPPGTQPGNTDVTSLVAASHVGPTSGRATASSTAISVTNAPNLILTKADSPDPVTSGSVITYAMTYRNTGNRNATGVILLDAIPANSSYVGGSASGETGVLIEFSTDNGASWGPEPANPATVTNIRWTVGGLAKASAVYQAGFRVRTASGLPDNTVIQNTAILRGDQLADVPANASTTISSGVDLSEGTKTVSSTTASPGDTLTYTILVKNAGFNSAAGVVVTDLLPPQTSYVPGSITGPGANDTGSPTLVWNLGSLAAGATAPPLTYRIVISNPVAANTWSISNTASIRSDQTAPVDTSIATTQLSASPFFVSSVKTSWDVDGGALLPGDDIEYRITVVNSGNMSATGVVVTDTVPTGTTYVAGSISGPGANASGAPSLLWNVGSLAGGGGSATLTFRARVNGGVPNGTSIVNEARISSNQTSPVNTPPTVDTVGGGTTGFIVSTSPIVPGDTVTLTVFDADLDTNPSTIQSFALVTTNTATGETENRTYTETGPATGVFVATVATVFGVTAGANNNGIFNVKSGDTLQTIYSDALTAGGGPGSSTATTVVTGGGATGTITSSTPILPGDTVTITLTDADLDTNPGVAESVTLTTTNSDTGESESRTYLETGPGTGVFVATVATVAGVSAGPNNDGVFNVKNLDALVTVYLDAVTASGGSGSVTATTDVIEAQITVVKSRNAAAAAPGDSIIYTVVHSNTGPVGALSPATTDLVPATTDFQLGSATFTPGTSGLTAVIAYSDDGGATFTYTPVSGGGGAPAGFDRNVTHVRWSCSGTLGNAAPGNSYSVSFAVQVR